MWLDATLAYLHFTAVFLLFAFLTVQVVVSRTELGAGAVRLLARMDLWYGLSSLAAGTLGFSRAIWGAKGWAFYSASGVFWTKVALFALVVALSVPPTRAFMRWRRRVQADGSFVVPETERARMRRYLMVEVHLAALIPVLAVVMSRGLPR
jgi:putative membrane protein